MKKITKVFMLACMSPLLMATQCDDDFSDVELTYAVPKVQISEGPDFSINDTVWIRSKVTANVYDEISGDSIPNPNNFTREIISIMRLREENSRTNASEAISNFILVKRSGDIDFLGACPEADLIAQTELVQNGQTFEYEIGLIPQNVGNFVLSWVEPITLLNNNLNTGILSNYPLEGSTDRLGLSKCGVGSFVDNVSTSRREYFFSVK